MIKGENHHKKQKTYKYIFFHFYYSCVKKYQKKYTCEKCGCIVLRVYI